MTQHVLAVHDAESKLLVVNELASGTGRRVMFTRTKHQAKKLAKQLTAAGIPAVDLHGNLSQPARERNLAAFSSGEDRKSTRLNSSHANISYAVFCLKKKKSMSIS